MPRTMDDWHFLNQLNQARAITCGVEHWRSHRGRCMGTIVWQLNDCWPVTSWAAIDSGARPKPMWYALRRAYDPRLLTVQPRGDALVAVAVNEGPGAWDITDMRLRRFDFDGVQLAEHTATLHVQARSTAHLRFPPELTTPTSPRREFLVVDGGHRRATWFFAPDKLLDYPVPGYDVHVLDGDGHHVVRVTARTVLRDLVLLPDRLHPDAAVDDMLVTLLPGETHDFLVTTPTRPSTQLVSGPPVLRCANDVVLIARAATARTT